MCHVSPEVDGSRLLEGLTAAVVCVRYKTHLLERLAWSSVLSSRWAGWLAGLRTTGSHHQPSPTEREQQRP